MDEIQAAVLCVKLAHVDEWNAERRQILARYAAATPFPASIVGSGDPTNACHLAVLRTPDRTAAARAMSDTGVATGVHYPILDCDQMSETGLPGRKLPLPVSEQARDEILSLPCYPCMTEAEIEQVSQVLTRFSCAAR
jgi:dTDP-4-amino-4,6-dideoxygalactose transaminase